MKNAPTAQAEPRKITIITRNKKAEFDYFVVERLEAGIVLVGTEVKALREGKCNLQDSYAHFKKNDDSAIYITGMHISPFSQGNIHNHEPLRERKLLLKKRELDKLQAKIREKGMTVVPLAVYFSGPYIKVELGLVKGKKLYDKRDSIKERDVQRSLRRAEYV